MCHAFPWNTTEPQAGWILPSHVSNQEIGARHSRRVRATLWFGAAALSLQGIGWAVFFIIRGAWPLVLIDLAVLAVGIGVGVLTHHRRTRLAFYLFLLGSFIVVCWSSLVNDIPSAQVPRATHLYLLVLGLAANLFLRDDPPVLRRSVVGVCLLTFIALASTSVGIATPFAMPDSVRLLGTWVHASLAILAMYVLMQFMMSDLLETLVPGSRSAQGPAARRVFPALPTPGHFRRSRVRGRSPGPLAPPQARPGVPG